MVETRPLRRWVVLVLFSSLAAACGGGTTDAGGNGTVSVSVSPTNLTVFQGATTTATVNVTRNNYSAPLTLSDSLAASGVTVSFNPPVLSGSVLSSTVTITATATAAPGQTSMVVHADGPGSVDAAAHAGVGVPILVIQPQVKIVLAGTGMGTVTSSPAGINCGGACSATFAPGTSITLAEAPGASSTFAGWTGGACSGTSATCTFVVTSAPTITATFNSTAQSFSLSAPTTASVAQGGNATATATITRVNGYVGAVSVTATGLPSGVTITAAPASTTDNTATLNISATSAVAAGNYPVTLSATGVGISGAQTTPLNIQVTPAAGGSSNVAFSFANCDPTEVPVWFAAQNGTGAWARVTAGANNTFAFSIGSAGSFAMVRPDGQGFSTTVFYGSKADITALALGSPCHGVNPSGGTKRLTGSITSGGAATHQFVSIGGAFIQHPAFQGSGFTLDGVPAGQRDLIAANFNNDANDNTSITRIILRRNVNYASSIPAIQVFGGTEDFLPANGRIVTNNTGTDQTVLHVSFVSANGASAPYSTVLGSAPARIPFPGLPDAVLQPGDLHALDLTATPASGSSARAAVLLRHSAKVDADTVTLGPTLNQPTITSLGTSPYLRLRAQLASQASYNVAALAEYAQGPNSVSVLLTANYANGTPATWVLDIPDLTSAGYDPTWGFKSGSSVDWQVTGGSGNVLVFFGATPADGMGLLVALVSNSSAAFNRFASFKGR